jgi:hypothetical protein
MVVASFVLVRIGIGVPQRPPSAGELGKQERVLAVDVQVVAHEGRQPGDIFGGDRVALGAELVKGGVDVKGISQHQAVEDQAQGAELVLHALVVALVRVPALAD